MTNKKVEKISSATTGQIQQLKKVESQKIDTIFTNDNSTKQQVELFSASETPKTENKFLDFTQNFGLIVDEIEGVLKNPEVLTPEHFMEQYKAFNPERQENDNTIILSAQINENEKLILFIHKNNNLTELAKETTKIGFKHYQNFIVENDINFVTYLERNIPDGKQKAQSEIYYDPNGNIDKIRKSVEGKDNQYIDTYYDSNNQPYSRRFIAIYNFGETQDQIIMKEEYFFVDEIISGLKSKNQKDIKATAQNILQINSVNYYSALSQYSSTTGNELIEDIKKKFSFDKNLQRQLLNHLNLMNNPEKYIIDTLQENIFGLQLSSTELKETIDLLDKDNIHYILYQYQMETYEKNKKLKEYLGESPRSANLLKFFGNGIIKHIQDEWHLTKDEQNQLIEKIINTVLKAIDNNSTIYAQDIKRDILSHRDDYEKIDIDIIRYALRTHAIPHPKTENIPSDGQIDDPFIQNKAGDCFILSPIISALLKNKSKHALEKCIKFDPKTGDETVYFKGSDKSYTIKSEDIKNSTHISNGDDDVKAIELAFDRLIRDLAYDNIPQISIEGKNVGIDEGGSENFVYYQLFGNFTMITTQKNTIPKLNFNDLNKTFSFSFIDNTYEKTNDYGEKYYKIGEKIFKSRHSYSIVRDDGFYIYILDPNEQFNPHNIEENLIKVPKEELFKKTLAITYADIS